MNPSTVYKYDKRHEQANIFTHGLGILLSLVFCPYLIYISILGQPWIKVAAIIFYSVTMLNTYFTSTLYHAARTLDKRKRMRILDHISIYFLIGGTYTPFILFFYDAPSGYWFLLLHWAIIVLGVVFKLFYTGRYEIVSTALYLFLGWMVIFVFEEITSGMNEETFYWLIFGGASYSVGVIFYIVKKIPFNHAIWHVFVIGGSFGHYMALLNAMN